MRCNMLVRFALSAALLLSTTTSTRGQDPITIAAFFTGLNNSVAQLTASGHNLIDHGSVAAGQQQLLLAATLKATIEQAQLAYEDSMKKTFDQIDEQRRGTFHNLQHLVSAADDIRGKSVADAQNLIYMTAGAANSLIGQLPFTTHTPVYYGAVPKDLFSVLNPAPVDIELLGFGLSDPTLNSNPPQIVVNGQPIPQDRVSAKFDRIQIQLPDKLREELRLKDDACDPMRSFTVELKVFYTSYPSLARMSSFFIKTSTFRDFVSPGKPLYEIRVQLDGTDVHDGTVDDPYRVSTGQKSWGCDQDLYVSAQFLAPEQGAHILNAQAAWANMGGRWENQPESTPTFVGATAAATGHVHGGNSQGVNTPFGRVSNCPGGGNGEMVLSGTYRHPVHSEEKFTFSNVAAFGDDVSIATPVKNSVELSSAHIEIRRWGCLKVVDYMDFPLQSVGSDQSSRFGFFKAKYEKGQLVVVGTSHLNH